MKKNLFIICMMMLVCLNINAHSDASHSHACSTEHSHSTETTKCTVCNTSGKCFMCHGSGTIYSVMGITYCPICTGTGQCRMCHGTGMIVYLAPPAPAPIIQEKTKEYQPSNHQCGVCKGSGMKIQEIWMGGSDTKWCSTCNKKVYITHQHVRCDNCNGKGYNQY